MMEKIAKFIPMYPDITDENFSYEIARKKEFYDSRLPRKNVPVKPGQLLPQQQFFQRFFAPDSPYSEALVDHGLGSGKTCTASAVVEMNKYRELSNKPSPKALILVKSDNLARQFRQEVANICTRNIYAPKLSKEEEEKLKTRGVDISSEAKERRLRSSISKTYEISTWETFLLNLPNNQSTIRKRFNNRVIIIDEAHNLRIQSGKKQKTSMYNRMWEFLHNIQNCKILLLTGTPIWDQTNEISSIMNLILPKNDQLSTGKSFDKEFFDDDGKLTDEGKTKLKEKWRGRISFLRSETTTAIKQEQGQVKPWLEYIKIYPNGMSDFQYKGSTEARSKINIQEVKGTKGRKTVGGVVLRDAREASNFIFPDGTYGIEGFKKHCVRKVKGDSGQTYQLDKETKDAIKTIEDLEKYSAKYAKIIREAKENPNQLFFVYTDEFVLGGGAILLSLLFQHLGWNWTKVGIKLNKNTTKVPRVATITSDPQTTSKPLQVENLISTFNDPRNKYGEYIQVLIGSEKAGEGLTLKNVRQVHITTPHWNIPSTEQAIGRVFRHSSHDALPENERVVKVFRHASVKAKKEGEDWPLENTTDIYLYKIAEQKEYRNTEIYRVIKEISFDCPLNYLRNVLPNDQPNSRECDYRECNFVCDGWKGDPNIIEGVYDYTIPRENIQTFNYDLLYNKEDVKRTMEAIILLFRSYFSLRLDMITKLINENDRELLLESLEILINTRVLIRDRYGFGNYLKEQNNIYFLHNNISSFAKYESSTYTARPLLTERTSLGDLVEMLNLEKDSKKVSKFCETPSIDTYNNLNYKTRIILLESSLQITNAKQQTIPESMLQSVNIIIESEKNKLYTMDDGNIVHLLYNEEYTGLSYNVTSKKIEPTGKMRVYDMENNEWNYVDPDQEQKYIEEIKLQINEENVLHFEDNPYGVIGYISKEDNKFRIKLKGERSRGFVCNESTKKQLYEIFFKLNVLPPSHKNFFNMNKESLSKNISRIPDSQDFLQEISDYSEDKLRGVLTLFTMSRDEMCDFLQGWLKDKKIFF